MPSGLHYIVRRDHPEFFTTQEVAAIVRRSKETIERWRWEGILVPTHSTQIGKISVWLYTEEEVDKARQLARTPTGKRKPREADRK